MEPDCYNIEVLHFANPHLIWVEVISHSNSSEKQLQQVGIYGIMPMDTTIDLATGGLKTSTSREWMPAAMLRMKQKLAHATEVWFRTTFIDRSTSIFDDNIHKYGELYIKNEEGKIKKLSRYLEKSGLAIADVCTFHQELSLGKLNTKLDVIKTSEVIREIEKYYKKKNQTDNFKTLIKKQMSVFCDVQKFDSALTAAKLDKHNRTVIGILQNKIKDLKMCKDIDDESVGRASREKSSKHCILKKKLEQIKANQSKHQSKSQDPLKMLKMTKQFLENNAVRKDNMEDSLTVENDEPMDIVKSDVQELRSRNTNELSSVDNESQDQEVKFQRRVKKTTKSHKKSRGPDIDITTHKYVAFAPPGINASKVAVKVVPIECKSPKNTSDNSIVAVKDDSNINLETNNDSFHNNSIVDDAIEINDDSKEIDSSVDSLKTSPASIFLQKRLKLFNEQAAKKLDTSGSETTNKDSSSSVEVITPIKKTKDLRDTDTLSGSEYKSVDTVTDEVYRMENRNQEKDSVFYKLTQPSLMVHSKFQRPVQTAQNLRDANFTTHIRAVLRNIRVERPMTIQTVSWNTILRGHSLFMISPKSGGKTIGYLPAVCRLVSDLRAESSESAGPTCIILCGTSRSATEVEKLAKMFMGIDEKVFSCYTGIDELQITTTLLNGCDLFICTPPILYRLLQNFDFGVDISRLSTLVIDDCEYIASVYETELKFFLQKIKEMLKMRINKEWLVQFVVASRIWCEFMEPLAKKLSTPVISIGAFQECVLYSKANTSIEFVGSAENKLEKVKSFIDSIDQTKKTVIACYSDQEVELISRQLEAEKYVVFSCDSTMDIYKLCEISKEWINYDDPVIGPILVCCDDNLAQLSINEAHNLLHYSLPDLFSMFCKRFAVLTKNYPSIFQPKNQQVKIKIFIEDTNLQQLPKIVNFIKRCTDNIPVDIGNVCKKIAAHRDYESAKFETPICGSLLRLGHCPDFWNCHERHTIFKEYDTPKKWVPKNGVVTFKILHYHSATWYSARLLSSISDEGVKKYSQTYTTLSFRLGVHYSKESNRKVHGKPKIGDVCAVPVRQSFFTRCQILKIINYYPNGLPNNVLVNLIDEERLTTYRDIDLYYLPDDLKKIETYVCQIRLANIKPRDKDVDFSILARDHLKQITDQNEEIYLRGNIALSLGNILLLDNLEACQDIKSLNKPVVRYDYKTELLNVHAISNPDHIQTLITQYSDFEEAVKSTKVEVTHKEIELPRPRWAHLEKNEMTTIFFESAVTPEKFFVRLVKFDDCMNTLLKDINKHVAKNPEPVKTVNKNDIVLAKFPDDSNYERARIDKIIDPQKVKCFFVDLGDWRDVSVKDIIPITEKLITKMPFQAIECRLVGIKPPGESWTSFSTNWFCDYGFEENGDLKFLYVQYYTKEKAECTGGHKYGVVIVDTNTDQDIVVNKLMIDNYLAEPNDNEIQYFDKIKPMARSEKLVKDDTVLDEKEKSSDDIENDWENVSAADAAPVSLDSVFIKKPIRSVPLVDSDEDSDILDKWDCNFSRDFMDLFQKNKPEQNLPAIEESTVPVANKDLLKGDNQILAPKESDILDALIESPKPASEVLDSDDTELPEVLEVPERMANVNITMVEEQRKPKLVWRQNKKTVSVKIMIIGAESYELTITNRSLKFVAKANDTEYSFKINLYGVIDNKASSHSNKGQYIYVSLVKVLHKNWLSLSNDSGIKKWIVYDVDSIDTSSSEDEEVENFVAKRIREKVETDSDDDDFIDDSHF